MVNPSPITPSPITPSQLATVSTDTWVTADWDAFLTFAEDPSLVNGRFYYDHGEMRIEMSPLGIAHGSDNSIISTLVVFYATVRQLAFKELTNTTFRRTGLQEAQPDIAFYIGEACRAIPRSNAPVNLDEISPPTLVVEIAGTSLQDDLDRKQRLYQRLGVQEYWVVDVNASQVTAFSLPEATEITTSQVLPNLAMSLVEEALRRAQTEDDGAVSRWLLSEFQG